MTGRPESAARTASVVVGVDHSAGARAALVFAVEEARLRHATLRVVHAWQYASIGALGMEVAGGAMLAAELDELRTRAEAALDATIREAIPDPPGIEIERRVVEGPAAAVLVAESHGADLLVVGSRGLGGFRGLLLGSVGQQCAHHAGCPVAIVPHAEDD
jgi:nucleotide-binding universal stress UspA family protein